MRLGLDLSKRMKTHIGGNRNLGRMGQSQGMVAVVVRRGENLKV